MIFPSGQLIFKTNLDVDNDFQFKKMCRKGQTLAELGLSLKNKRKIYINKPSLFQIPKLPETHIRT